MKTPQKLSILFILGMIICFGLSSNINIRNLQQENCEALNLEKKVYVTQRSGNYYTYKVYSDNRKIIIDLLDSDVKEYQFTFKSKENQLYFRDAYNKFVIVQEMTSDNQTITYWLLIITETNDIYSLDSYPVNSMVDNQGYQFNNSYLLKSIVEYNEVNSFLYVDMETYNDSDVYAIDLANRGNIMLVIGYFYYSKTTREQIVGGNSRVLVEKTTDSLWFNTGNLVSSYISSIYNKVYVSSLTTLPIYPQGSNSYSFLSSYFQYVSLSSDGYNMTTFIFQDYVQTTTIYAEGSLNSSSQPIKIFSDEETFFLAVADNDIYISTVTWNSTLLNYQIYSTQLSQFVSDETERVKWLKVFNSIIVIVLIQDKFFILSENYFYVLSQNSICQEQLSTSVNSSSNVQRILFTHIKKYLSNNS